ncbi:MAG: hypothetical protein JRM80_12710 [Nitrososphaerota archaeon]|nr:hypothetical protein [Nitrososphaerota archaeon]
MGPKVRIERGDDPLGAVLRGETRRGWGLDLLGLPLAAYGIARLQEAEGAVEQIFVPPETDGLADALGSAFPSAEVLAGREGPGAGCYVVSSDSLSVRNGAGGEAAPVRNPWTLLGAMSAALKSQVRAPLVASTASVAATAVLSGPCVISDGAVVDDFCKIKGPAYLGPRSKVWTGSLVRESMIGPDCEIGFGCEIGRSYMLGRDRTAHHDVILDSVLGDDVWMGAFVGTTNRLLTNANVRYMQDGKLEDTGLDHFGAVFGHGSGIGAGTLLLPGRFVPPGAIIQAGTVYAGPADVKLRP